MPRTVLRDDQWERIADLLPGKPSDPGCTAADNRGFVEAVLWVLRTGAPWRDLPEEFGNWNSLYQRFARWERKGVWDPVFEVFSQDADFQDVFIDSSIIRVHQHGAGAEKKNSPQAIGRSRGGLTTKIHALVDALGNPARGRLTTGQVHDIVEAEALIEGVPTEQVIADKGYDSKAFIDTIHARGAKANIPARAGNSNPRDFDAHEYKARNLVGRFFNRIKHFRRIATRYEKLDGRYNAMLTVAAVVIWLA